MIFILVRCLPVMTIYICISLDCYHPGLYVHVNHVQHMLFVICWIICLQIVTQYVITFCPVC